MSSSMQSLSSALQVVSRPLVILGILLFLTIALMLGSLVYVGNKRADLQKHLELASEQILLSQRIATYSFGASSGRENDFGKLLRARTRFEDILNTYRNGDELDGVPPLSKGLLTDLDTAESDWQKYRADVDIILRGKKPIAEIQELYDVIDSFVPQLLTFSDEVVGQICILLPPA